MIAEKPSWVRHEGMQIFSIDIQPGGYRFATGGGDHKVRIWNMNSVSRDLEINEPTQRLLATLRDHFGSVNCVRWAKHGRYVASGSDDQVILVHERKPGSGTTEFGSGEPPDVENWKVAMTLRGHTADVILGKDLFTLLKEKWGADLNSLISKKIVLVPGDISYDDDLGVKDSNLREEIWSQLDVVVNLAATTNFDERYDVALGINTMGAKHVLCFAKKCVKLKVLVHVSTAYVSGERAGLILEASYGRGDTLNGVSGLDIDEEKKLVDQKLNELQAEGATTEAIKEAMKDMGIERAKVYGWPNTYVFTKAMGEMLVGDLKENLSVVIIRPTIVTSTLKEPFPGWVEGIRTIDSLAVGYGKGRLTCFLGDITGIVDVIPADMVVNAIVVAMVAHANRPFDDAIYQVGSSVRNPVRYTNLQDFGFDYFTKKPWIGKDGKPVKVGRVKVLSSMANFHGYMAIRYLLLLKGLELANIAFCHYFENMYTDLNRKIKFVMKLVELYRPYLFFRGVFDDMNTEKLRMAAGENNIETDMFYFDPKAIDWEDYFTNIHIPGVVKYVFR